MKKSTVLSLTTAAVILAAYVPNEVILADTPSSEDSLKISDKETVIDKQNENKENLEDIHNVIETSKDTEEKKTTIVEEKEVVSKNPVIDNNTSNEVKTQKVPKKRINLSILLNLKIKNLEKKQSRSYQILRIQKFYILMIEFLTVALLKQPKILWTKLN